MPIDDEFQKRCEQLEAEIDPSLPKTLSKAVASAFAGITVPVIGPAIFELFAGLAQERHNARFRELLQEIKLKVEHVSAAGGALNEEFYRSEEFQTIIALVLEQLQLSHDRDKIRLLAAAVVNSGTDKFASGNRKELFVRVIRDLTSNHISLLASMYRPLPDTDEIAYPQSNGIPPHTKARRIRMQISRPSGEELLMCQNLASFGLVQERFLEKKSMPTSVRYATDARSAASALEDWVTSPPERAFDITELGIDFLAFLGEEGGEQREPTPK